MVPSKSPGMLLLAARLADVVEGEVIARILETLGECFSGQGASAGGDQPPAFVAGEVARCCSLSPVTAPDKLIRN